MPSDDASQDQGDKEESASSDTMKDKSRQRRLEAQSISGTTLRVYRLLYKEGRPLGISEVQTKAGLSSPSLAYYHLNKLVDQELASQKDGGFLVDRVIFDRMIRIRRSLIPLQATFTAFFVTMVIGLVVFLRPHSNPLSAIFIFALITNCVAIGIFAFQTVASLREYHA